jgi:hypothetical protein
LNTGPAFAEAAVGDEGSFNWPTAKVMGVPHPPSVGFGTTGRSNRHEVLISPGAVRMTSNKKKRPKHEKFVLGLRYSVFGVQYSTPLPDPT